MKRRDVLRSALASAALTAMPNLVRAEAESTITFVPHADLASLDPVWTTADITRNFSLAVYDTLYAFDAEFNVRPQMAAVTRSRTTASSGRSRCATVSNFMTVPRCWRAIASRRSSAAANATRWARR